MMTNEYAIPCRTIGTKNTQANAILERVHQTLSHSMNSYVIKEINSHKKNPWEEISHLLCSPYGLWRKQTLINKSNQKENRSRQSHVSCTGDKVLLKNAWKTKFNQDSYISP